MKLSLSFIQTALKKQGIDTILVCADGRRYERVVLLEYALLDGYSDDTLYVCDEGELAQVNEPPESLCVTGTDSLNPDGCGTPRGMLTTGMSGKVYVYHQIAEIFLLYNKWEREVSNLIFSGGTLQNIIDSVKMVTRNPCYVMDNSLHIRATIKDADLEDMSAIWRFQYYHRYWPLPQTLSMINTTDLSSIKKNPHARIFLPSMFNMPCCAIALSKGREFFGYLFFIEVYYHLDITDIEVIERLKELILAMYELRGEEPQQQSGTFYEKTFIKAASGEYKNDPVALKQELALLGWQDDHRFRTLSLGVDLSGDNDAIYVLNSVFGNELKGKIFYLDGYLNCVFSYRETPDFEKQVRYYLKRFRLHCGASEVFSNLKDLEYYHNQAVFTLKHVNTAPEDGAADGFWHNYSDIFPFHMGVTLKEPLQKEKLWSDQLEHLRAYDETHHTDYVNTLFWYLQEERNVAHTARKLNLHRNSLLYRLDKINEILGLDLDNPAVRLRVLLEIYVMAAEDQP